VIIARHIDIVQENVNAIGFKNDDGEYEDGDRDRNDTVGKVSCKLPSEQKITNCENEYKGENEQEMILKRSRRERKRPDRYGEAATYSNYIYVNFVSADTPTSYEKAINSEDSLDWKQAMDKEMRCLIKNKSWKLVDRPKDRKVLDVKWVFMTKADNKKKARLVVRGFQQEEEVDNLYSPVIRMQILKILLAHCSQYGLTILQMDVEAAFLNGKIKFEIYVSRGYEDGTDRDCRLYKALYGLQESPRAWYECLDKYLQERGFRKRVSDYCLYILGDKDEVIYMIIFVDNLLICKNEGKLKDIKDKLSDKFKMKDFGEVRSYLGINIKNDCNKNEITQIECIKSLARKFHIIDLKNHHVPMEQNLKLEPAPSEKNNIKFKNLIGTLLYISTGTRPDISYSVNYLSMF